MARPGLRKHPKFLLLQHLLQEPEPHCLGYLELLWDTAYENGDALIGSALTVELVAKYPGKRGKLVEALTETRLLDQLDDGSYAIHDLWDHAPRYVLQRRERELERLERGQDRKIAFAPRTRSQTAEGRTKAALVGVRPPKSELGPPPAPAPAPSLARAPKEKPPTEVCSEQRSVAHEPADAPALVFPTTGKEGKEWTLTEAKLAEYRESFPGLDVLAECRAARQWCLDNPKKRKTARGMPAFLTRWLNKAQNGLHGKYDDGLLSRSRANDGCYDNLGTVVGSEAPPRPRNSEERAELVKRQREEREKAQGPEATEQEYQEFGRKLKATLANGLKLPE